jgi:hypothetical protein
VLLNFFIHFFFHTLVHYCYHHVLIFKCSHTIVIDLLSYIVISKFFFFYYYYYYHSCCSVLLHNPRGAMRLLWSRVSIHNLCAIMKLHIKKILTDFCDTRTHFAALARACFHEPHVCDKSLL